MTDLTTRALHTDTVRNSIDRLLFLMPVCWTTASLGYVSVLLLGFDVRRSCLRGVDGRLSDSLGLSSASLSGSSKAAGGMAAAF